MRKTILAVCTVLAASSVAAADGSFAAAPDLNNVVLSRDGRQMMVMPSQKTKNVPSTPYRAAADRAIFDNLNEKYPHGTYYCCYGWTLGGPSSIFGQSWIAAAFTPTADATVGKIVIGAGYAGGENEYIVTLNSDASGLPGAELASFHVKNAPVFGTCCVVAKWKDKTGTPVIGGQQYWVVVKTSDNSTFYGEWNTNTTELINDIPVAGNRGSGWEISFTHPTIAFGVFAQK